MHNWTINYFSTFREARCLCLSLYVDRVGKYESWAVSFHYIIKTFKYEQFIPHHKPDLKYEQYIWIQNASTKIKHMSYRIPASDLHLSWSDRKLWFRWLGSQWRKDYSNYYTRLEKSEFLKRLNFCTTNLTSIAKRLNVKSKVDLQKP